MRLFWEVVSVVLGIAIILGIAKGFPAFGRVLLFLIINPVGLTLTVGLILWIAWRRKQRAARQLRDRSGSP